ncbi:MAG: Lpg1974 family pore-forming outer membrane protein [Simkaniaceae bacterium]|nr:Lpg1974 family pore-forming outer membrane protein [Simkaniaceae bacterium]
MDIDSRVIQLENQQQVCAKTPYGTQTALPRTEGYSWSLSFDVLYWHANINGTEFAAKDEKNKVTIPIKAHAKGIDFKWNWGIRIGLGYNFAHDSWDFRGQYTWSNTSGSRSVASDPEGLIKPVIASPYMITGAFDPDELFEYCQSATSQHNFGYRAIDLELGRVYSISGTLSLRPHWGLTTAWIHQEQMTRYTGGSLLNTNSVYVKNDCKFWGLGPCLGLDSRWHLGYGLSIFSNIASSLLVGSFAIEQKQSYTGIAENKIELNANPQALSPTTQMQIGLCYDKCIRNNTQHIGVGLGFEVQQWWRQNQMINSDDASEYKNQSLSMHGLTLDIQWDF